jgi:hypothetical protein
MKAYGLLINNPFDVKDSITWLSTLQRNVTASAHNHGAILIEDDQDFFGLGKGWFIVESIGHGVHIITLKEYLSYSTNRITNVVDFTALGFPPNFNFLNAQIGKKYQFSIWWSYSLFLLLNKIFGHEHSLTKKLTNVNNPDCWYCFELLGEFFGLGLGSAVVGKTIEDKFADSIKNVNLYTLLNRNKLEYTDYARN